MSAQKINNFYHQYPQLPLRSSVICCVRITTFLISFLISFALYSQNDTAFYIRNIQVEGNQRTSGDAIIILSQLKIGDWIRMSGTKAKTAVSNLWETGEYKNVYLERKDVKTGISITIHVEEYLSLGEIQFVGFSKSEERLLGRSENIAKLKVYSPHSLNVIKQEVSRLLVDKGFVHYQYELDAIKTLNGRVSFQVKVIKGNRYRVGEIEFVHDYEIKDRQFQKAMNALRPKKVFWPGSIYSMNEKGEIGLLQETADNLGYYGASVEEIKVDTLGNKVNLRYTFSEADKETIGEFSWEGNEVYSDSVLNSIAQPLTEQLYSRRKLIEVLQYSDKMSDITSLYMDNGYALMQLRYRLVPNAHTNRLDVYVNINEGPLLKYGVVGVSGNVRTKDHVMKRELITTPGEEFSRSDILLSQQKLNRLDYFKPSAMDVSLIPDTANGTADLTYIVEEKISDKLLISGGYGSGRLVGTLGFDFKNFSGGDIFKKGTRWKPLPAGGGQHLSLKGQTDGVGYYGVMFSFMEPWVGGRPIGLSFSSNYARYNDSIGTLNLFSVQSTLSHQPIKSDPFTHLNYQLSYRNYQPNEFNVFGLTTGNFNALSLKVGVLNNTTDNNIFPSKGKVFKASVSSTLPPYSRFTAEEALSLTDQEKFKWFEYYKLKFSWKQYTSLDNKRSLILESKFGAGYLGNFNSAIGDVPFERFIMGGTGMTNFDISANEFIGLRGYDPEEISSIDGDPMAVKLSFELRKKLLQADQYMISTHLFAESGGTFSSDVPVSLNNLNHSVGVGARVFTPVVGMLGIDVGWGLSKPGFSWKDPMVQFTLGMNIGDF